MGSPLSPLMSPVPCQDRLWAHLRIRAWEDGHGPFIDGVRSSPLPNLEELQKIAGAATRACC
jgi:hypothetical protein